MPASAERGRSQTDVQRIVDRCCNPRDDNDEDEDDNDDANALSIIWHNMA